MKPTFTSRNGFTLIELLVGIAIFKFRSDCYSGNGTSRSSGGAPK